MKIKSRFVFLFAVLSLLASFLIVIPVFASEIGTVTLAGGALNDEGVADGKFFSDKDGFNIVTATTEDADLGPTMTGVAMFEHNGTGTIVGLVGATINFNLTGTSVADPVFSSEKDMVLTFDGGDIRTTFLFATATNSGLTGPQTRGRNRDSSDATLDTDDVVAKVSGTTVTVAGVTINADGYITAVTLASAPPFGTDNVEITIGISEYDQTAPTTTPINSALFAFGDAFDNTPDTTGASAIINSTGTIISGFTIALGKFVKVTFNYNVQETKTDLMSFTTPTLSTRGLTRKLDGVETTFDSNKFVARAALFSGPDFDVIKSAVDNSADTIDDIQADAGVGVALDARISVAVTALGTSVIPTEATAGSAAVFLAHLVPISDGDVLTVSYNDADPSGIRTATADIDMKAPTITQVWPGQMSFTNSLSQTLVLEVDDEPSVGGNRSGMATTDVDEIFVTTSLGGPSGNVVVPLFLGGEAFRASLSKQFTSGDEGPVSWFIVAKDKVGNAPANTVLGTNGNPFKFNLDITPAAPTAAGATRPVVTGGKLDTRFAVPLTGSATLAGTPTTQLEDANAKFVTNGVKVGDRITNTTDGSTATVVIIGSQTQITHSALSGANSWAVGEGYKIENPKLNTVIADGTAVGNVSIYFDLGAGRAPLDEATLDADDFLVDGVAPSSLSLGAVNTTANEQGILLTLASDLATDATPSVELTGFLLDKAGNIVATFTDDNALIAKDGLSPVLTLTVTGTAASRPVTNNKITISIVTNEDTGTPTVSVYTVGSPTTSGNAVGATIAVPDPILEGPRSWKVEVSPGPGLYNVFAKASDIGGNLGKIGIEGVAGSDTDPADIGIQIDLDKAILFEKDTGIPNPVFLPASISPSSLISIDYAGEGNEYGLETCTAVSVPNPNCDAADVAAERGHLSTDPSRVDTSYDEHQTVTLISATLDGEDITGDVTTQDDRRFFYQASGLSIGEHELSLTVMDESGNERVFLFVFDVIPAEFFCIGVEATIVGTEGDDILVGTPGNDVIVGLSGDDIIIGLDGSDLVCGGTGNDVILGGDGNDLLLGDQDDDILDGGSGTDLLIGGVGKDIIAGRGDTDLISCGPGVDIADGGQDPDFTAPDCEFELNIP